MLKALEVIGFKSFADKTRFEFPDGITVVVGPNGSGKSNVVDAIKWVLGEQSAKSLRGQDMADVIFKGGGNSGRKPMNSAEATIVFENADHRLPVDAPEVHVTRRVYRSGEGEYLINRQPCRLKDIKDLFRGTGVGVDAYSIIEQGKVDRLLQASPKDRRAMFEEAAGISRFKAKKIEAQRRLERVDQNLLRLNDIVEEVDARVRSVRAQAAKAKKYREYSERLQQLRTEVGLADWRKLSEKLHAIEREQERLRNETGEIAARTELLDARLFEIETDVSNSTETIRDSEGRVARFREQIVGIETGVAQQRSRAADLDEEATRGRQNLIVLTNKAGDLQQRLAELRAISSQAEAEHQQVVRQVTEQERQLNALTAELEKLRGETESRRNEYVAKMRSAAALSNEVSGHRSQLASLSELVARCRQRLDEVDQTLASLATEQEQLQLAQQQLETQLAQRAEQLEEATRELAENRRVHVRRQQDVVELLGRLSGAQERSSLLGELESKREGISSGAKEVLELAKDEPHGPFADVQGLVADTLQASLELAPLIDVALGNVAQHVVLRGEALIERIATGAFRPSARVGFIRAELIEENPQLDGPELVRDIDLEPGIIGRADRLVETITEHRPLVHRLLGKTWIVEDLSTALHLQANVARDCRFVTSAGQLLETDGTIIAGPRQGVEGLVSRRSELRDLRQRVSVLEWQIAEGQREVLRLQENIDRQDRDVRQLTDEQKELTKTLNGNRARLITIEQRQQELTQQRAAIDNELDDAIGQQDAVNRQLDDVTSDLGATEASITDLETSLQLHDRRIEELDTQRHTAIRTTTAAKVELAKSEQRLEGMQSQVAQFEHDQRERSKAVAEARTQLAHCLERRTQCDRAMLAATSELAYLYLQKEQQAAEAKSLAFRRDDLLKQRTAINKELDAVRRQVKGLEEQLHTQELAANEVRHERTGLVERLKEDYGIDIADTQSPTTGDELQQREQVEEEIATLRKKINSLGAVNMDALAESDELEARFASISAQFQDLKQAKEALERIIQKINADSRKLFLDTLEAIRTNFQTLYRRAFGGGRADIVLEAGADVLECGVDILATPPGKPSFSNSLLSGGEKALTAVALLLAIFQFRPSPFCVLDEVDAPFDEANVGRFVSVLKDFLSFTKFIIVTHSKKTMTAATTLYGVTMQESGVSKRVSVQFDDVTDDGHIRKEAVDREDAAQRSNRSEAA